MQRLTNTHWASLKWRSEYLDIRREFPSLTLSYDIKKEFDGTEGGSQLWVRKSAWRKMEPVSALVCVSVIVLLFSVWMYLLVTSLQLISFILICFEITDNLELINFCCRIHNKWCSVILHIVPVKEKFNSTKKIQNKCHINTLICFSVRNLCLVL